uniref:LITAF domain-containing protein n=2 Tax=Arion vulgaris TaxID=1028688 RepID=A0A0B7AKK4_9EUPU
MSKEQAANAPPYLDGSPYPPPSNAYPPQYVAGQGPQGYPAGYPNQPAVHYGQQPNQAGYSHGTTVVVAQPTVAFVQVFRDSPVHTNCPHCRAEIVTATQFETGTFTWVICCVLWFVGCGLGCCLIPFCVDGCKDVIHACPNCHQQIGRFSRM